MSIIGHNIFLRLTSPDKAVLPSTAAIAPILLINDGDIFPRDNLKFRTLGRRRPVAPISFAGNVHVRLQGPTLVGWRLRSHHQAGAAKPALNQILYKRYLLKRPGGVLQPDGGRISVR